MARAETNPTVIDLPSRTGVRGRLDKLLQEYTTKAQALRITVEILDEDDRRQALEEAPRKFLHAINHRQTSNGHAPVPTVTTRKPLTERIADVRDYLATHPGANTHEIAAAVGVSSTHILKLAPSVAKGEHRGKAPMAWTLKGRRTETPMPRQRGKGRFKETRSKQRSTGWYEQPVIHGQALTLFLLENLAEGKSTAAPQIADQLAQAGSPLKSIRILNGPLASASKTGAIKRFSDGYRITSKAAPRMAAMRSKLEAKGLVKVGGYAP